MYSELDCKISGENDIADTVSGFSRDLVLKASITHHGNTLPRRKGAPFIQKHDDTIFNQLHNYRNLIIICPNVSSQTAAAKT